MLPTTIASVAVSLALAAAAAAQGGVPFTLTSSCTPNVVYRQISYPTTLAPTAGNADLRAGGAMGADPLFQAWWYYRLESDPSEFPFSNNGNSGLATPVINTKGDEAVLTWTNCDGKGFDAQLTYRVYSTGAASGVCTQCMTITNNTGAPLVLNLYAYADYDIAGPGADSATFAMTAPNAQQQVSDATDPTRCFFLGCGIDNYEAAVFPLVRSRLLDAVPDDLPDAGVPFGPGDWSSAYQWQDRTIPAGGTFTACAGLAIGAEIPCCDRATITNYCTAKPGTNGLPAWGRNPLYVGGTSELKVTNGVMGSAPAVLIGQGGEVCLPVEPFGTLAVFPLLLTFNMPAFDSMNTSKFCLGIPRDTTLCGTAFNLQAWFPDPGAANFPLAHTDGCTFVIGGL
jgi:hypothetical protein